MTDSIYDIEVHTPSNSAVTLDQYKGKVMLIVNTASKCGFTPQLEGLEALYQKYHEQGLVVLGFPCNQFMGQEPKTNDEITEFCSLNYGVTFPIFAKIDVNGEQQSPLFEKLKNDAPGLIGSKSIKWNFTKFLVSKDGKSVQRFAPKTTPENMTEDIELALK